MSIFKPDFYLKSIMDITPGWLKSNEIDSLILDVDNTLTKHNCPEPAEGILNWLKLMKSNNIGLIIVSNNSYERVLPFAEKLGLEFISNGKKPLSVGNNKALKILGADRTKTAVVGDQVFTDVLGGKLGKIKTIMTRPIELESNPFFKFKRSLERIVLKNLIDY